MSPLEAPSTDLADLAARAAPSVVGLETRDGQGSGVVRAMVLGRPAELELGIVRDGRRARVSIRPRARRAAA